MDICTAKGPMRAARSIRQSVMGNALQKNYSRHEYGLQELLLRLLQLLETSHGMEPLDLLRVRVSVHDYDMTEPQM